MANEVTPRIALTPGEPAGIGPDLCVLAAQMEFPCELIAFADPDLLTARADTLGVALQLTMVDPDSAPCPHQACSLKVAPVQLRAEVELGKPDIRNVGYVLKTITRAVNACIEGNIHGLVTGPVHKGIVNDAGIPFSGHTEYIANLTGGHPVMLLTASGLRVALATTHLPLCDVSKAITRQRLKTVLTILRRDLQSRFGIDNPHILVCGLNPHAGEGGHMGREEIDIIEPTLVSLRQQGLRLEGPLPADTLFTPKYLDKADAVLAMYHDQGLPVLKHIGFGQAVNITLGLPIIRTSVDHGTALELAGRGQVNTGSLEAAIQTAIAMARNDAILSKGRREADVSPRSE